MKEFILAHPVWYWSNLASFILSTHLTLRLWIMPHHQDDRRAKKWIWTIILFMPFFGPLFYGAFYKVPKIHKPGEASKHRPSVAGSGYQGF